MTIIREMVADDIDRVTLFLRDNFYGHEPLMQTPGDHKVPYDNAKRREYRLSRISQGTCLVAVDQTEGERIVGVAFAGAMHPSTLEENWLEATKEKPKQLIEHIHYFLSNIERNAGFFERYGISEALYLGNLTVDATVRRQGLGKRLVTALMELGRSRGFPLLVTTCSSYYSTRVMISLGMECVLSAPYAEYKDEAGQAVIIPPQPHTEVSVMAIKL